MMSLVWCAPVTESMWSWWNLFTVYDSWGIDQSNLTADCITYGVSLLATVALIALYDGAERRMTTRGHQEFLLSSKARVTCIHAILWIIDAYKHANIHIWTQPPAKIAIAMWLHGRGGAPLLTIFEFSMMHLITASKQFISYRSMYTNFTTLSLIHPVAPGLMDWFMLYRSGWSAARSWKLLIFVSRSYLLLV